MTKNMDSLVTSVEIPVLEKQILIVEDETVFAKAVQKQLKRSGYNSDIAVDLKSANEKFKSLSPDMVLLDMRLPDGSGLDSRCPPASCAGPCVWHPGGRARG